MYIYIYIYLFIYLFKTVSIFFHMEHDETV